jgi:hypothetical protein
MQDRVNKLVVVAGRPVREEGVAGDGQDVPAVAVNDADQICEVGVEVAGELFKARRTGRRDPVHVRTEAHDVGQQQGRPDGGRLELLDRAAGRHPVGDQPRDIAREVVRRRGPSSPSGSLEERRAMDRAAHGATLLDLQLPYATDLSIP